MGKVTFDWQAFSALYPEFSAVGQVSAAAMFGKRPRYTWIIRTTVRLPT